MTATDLFEEKCKELERWLVRRKTSPELTIVICSRLRSWHAKRPDEPFRRPKSRGVRRALEAQKRITWDAAFEGFWSVEWAKAQDVYYQYKGSQRPGFRWLVHLIQRIWKIAWDLWEDRNKCNATRKSAAKKVRVGNLIRAEYEKGYLNLHRSSHKLFTRFSLEQRVEHSVQTMESWLYRVEAARHRAEMDPIGVAQDRREYLAARRAANITVQMQNNLMTWLQTAENS